MSEAGEITNLGGPDAGHRPRPPPVPRRELAAPEPRAAATTSTGKPGLDVFYNITPSLKLTATFNTDFGETEVDARQINLTRFSLLFPEKRAFFLRGRRRVQLRQHRSGDRRAAFPRPAPTSSRSSAARSACSAAQEVPIDAGVKLTGTVGRTDIGVLDVRTGDLGPVG